MIDDKPSYTAIHVAATRAAHLRFDPPPHLFEDTKAEALLGPDYADLIEMSADGAHWVLLENRLFFPFRARWAEDRLHAAYDAGVRQYVILGAGLDTFSFRQPDATSNLAIIEVDHPATQQWKLERIRSLEWEVPANTHFIACDFEKTSVIEALASSRFDPEQPAVISWMGVTYYLERALAQAALAELAGALVPRSEVVFDYLIPYGDLSERYLELEQTSGQYLKSKGEPHVNKLRPADVGEDIMAAGFRHAVLEDRDDLAQRYFAELRSEIPMSERFGLAVAGM